MTITADVVGFSTLAATMIFILTFVIRQNVRNEKGREGIYKRLDNDRVFTANTYVRQDIHATEYKGMKEDVSEIKADMKKLLQNRGIK